MGRLSSARRVIAAAAIAGAASFALAGCENALLAYLFKGILYQGWKVASWSAPAPVVAGETHELGKSNGFPMNMAMGSNGKLHLVGWKVNDLDWVSTSMEPGAAEFNQAFTLVNSTPNPDDLGRSPGIDLVTDDIPIIAYGVGSAGVNHSLYYQELDPGPPEVWRTAQEIDANGSSLRYAPVFVCFFSSDFKPHLWYLSGGKIYHTVRMNASTIAPDPPAEWLPDVGKVAAARAGANDFAFAYTDGAGTTLFYRTWLGSGSTPIWTAPADTAFGEVTITTGPDGAAYISFGTRKASDPNNVAFFVLRSFTNRGGSWHELASITGTASAGPMSPCSIVVAPDRFDNDHIHMVYTMWTLPFLLSVWYTYYDDSGWHAPQNLDTLHNAIYPQIAVDPAGTVHVVYSWYSTELDRTLMYVRGTPREAQNQ